MQKRFCSCGRDVYVHYALTRGSGSVRFWAKTGRIGENVKRCPECGRDLSIDKLH